MEFLILFIVPLVTAIICRLVSTQLLMERLNASGAAITLGAGGFLAFRVFREGAVFALGDLLYVDALGALIEVLIVLVGFLGALYSIGYIRRDIEHGKAVFRDVGWYYLRYHLFIWTMLITVTINNLGLLWVAIEASTLVSSLLVGFYRSRAALEAAWKYLIINTVGITFALFGVLLIYYASTQAFGEEVGLTWTALSENAARLNPGLIRLAFAFILVGFGTKAGFAPLHTWLPDAHSQAPSPVSAILSGVLLKCGLYGILRVHLITIGAVGPEFSSNLLLGFGLFSVIVAVPFILVQRDFKRLLAYSSVEHIGLITTAIGIGGPIGLYAGFLHLLNHAITKPLLFFVAGNLSQGYGTTRISGIRAVIHCMPVTGTFLLLGLFAITGIPPFGMFVSEFGIIGAGFARGDTIVAVILTVALAIVFTGALAFALNMAFGKPRGHLSPVPFSFTGSFALFIPCFLLFFLGLYIPPPVNQIVQQIVSILGGGV